jgi:hypothetical protein
MKARPVTPAFFGPNFDFDVSLEVLGAHLWDTPGSTTYEPERCGGCGKIDTIASLKGGSARSVDPTRVKVEWGRSVEWGHTRDAQTVMSSRMLATVRKVPGVEIDAYPIGPAKKPTHWVVWPSRLLPAEPMAPQKKSLAPYPPDIAFLSHGPRCKTCGRFLETTFNVRWIAIPPDTILGGFSLEKDLYQSPVWVFSAAVAEAMKKFPHARLRLWGYENRPPRATPAKPSGSSTRRTRRST